VQTGQSGAKCEIKRLGELLLTILGIINYFFKFQLHRFAIDTAHSKIIFSASGVFNIDRELLLAVKHYRIYIRMRVLIFMSHFSPFLQESSICPLSCSPAEAG
jgi:hypothetical protein